jgi:amidase
MTPAPAIRREACVRPAACRVASCAAILILTLDHGGAAEPSRGAVAAPEFVGRWEVTTTYRGGSFVAGLTLKSEGARYRGESGYLVPDFSFYEYVGDLSRDGLHLQVMSRAGHAAIGTLVVQVRGGSLVGRGTLHGVAIRVDGRRPRDRPPGAPTVHDFVPRVFYTTYSYAHPPVLRIFPGDTVRTKTVDAHGGGEAGPQTLPGNPQTGPFYIEGAMPGDTIAVHFNKIAPNRDWAFQNRDAIDPGVLPPGYPQKPSAGWSNLWRIDREHLTATPVAPSPKLGAFTINLIPMLGCVAVAPEWNQAITSEDLGSFGGNLDYNGIRSGTTLYLPVYEAGAMLTMGDGHALQADGEITGQGLETSMNVEFSVQLLRNQFLGQPWAENAKYIMVSGIGRSVPEALQLATAGLANWLKSYYGLSTSEIATVLAVSVHYNVAELVDPHFHVVAVLPKSVLEGMPKPPLEAMFCDPASGCTEPD